MKKVILLTVLILLISLAYSFAEVPCKINYQGRLIENNVPVDGTKPMSFSIYDSAAGGDELWTSGNVDITVYNGLFRYVLGEGFIDGSPVADLSGINWTAGETLYLEVQVGADILTPREAIYAYPYAINSHLLEGATKEYFLNTSAETQKKDGGLNIMGNVGIGTTDPQGYKLYVAGDILSNTGRFYNADKDDYIEIRASDESIRFFTQDAEKLTILNSGRVGIGTTSPGAKLHIAGAGNGIMFPDGSLQTTAAAVKVGQGSVANGNDFNVQCGMSGTVLLCLKFDFKARYGDMGTMTARLRSQGGSSTLKTRTGRVMEYDSRYSSAHVQIFYISTGNNPGETLTFNTYTPDGSHLINNPDYWYIGL